MAVVRRLLENREISVGKGICLAVPIHHKRGYAHVASLHDLPTQNARIITRVSNVQVHVVAKPRHVNCEQLWTRTRSLQILLGHLVHSWRGTATTYHETYNCQG